MNRIDATFARLREAGRPALIPFVTAGDPDLATTAAIVPELVARGADLVEIGLPYSDPIADGPVIAASYNRALAAGTRLDATFAMLRILRDGGDDRLAATPMVAMVSVSIVHRRGVQRFLDDAVGAGLDGLIVPDLPVEESAALAAEVAARDLRLVLLVTPTTPADRALSIAGRATGFVYYVAVAGLTGERRELPATLAADVARLRSQSRVPVCVGFGISGPEQVRALVGSADGLIVGSALVRRIAEAAAAGADRAAIVDAAGAFVAELSAAIGAGATQKRS